MSREYTVAVVGATGVVGREMVHTLGRRAFPLGALRLFASERSAGAEVEAGGRVVTVEVAREDSFAGIDLALFSAGAEASRQLAPAAAAAGCLVIDNSSAWRMAADVPLVVPEVNGADALANTGIIANPNCSTIQLMVALEPLRRAAGLRRVVVDTYQAASGAGHGLMDELDGQVRELAAGRAPRANLTTVPLAGNAIPQIDVFLDGGHTKEELKVREESRKILHLPDLRVAVTCVRVPVRIGHSLAVHVELESPLGAAEARAILAAAPGITVIDDPAQRQYPTPAECAGRDEVFVGRIRRDDSVENGLSLWIVADNLLKGAALNAVQIAEWLDQHRATAATG